MTCLYCQLIKEKKNLVYEDDNLIAVMHPKPFVKGQILVIPKRHYQILEQIPDYEAAEIFKVVNKISIAAFESVKATGTNTIIQNGVAAGQLVPHFCVNIIPRKENDGLDFQWKPKQLSEEEISTIELKLKQEAESIGAFEKEKKKEPVVLEEKTEKIEEKKDRENYLIRQLEKIP